MTQAPVTPVFRRALCERTPFDGIAGLVEVSFTPAQQARWRAVADAAYADQKAAARRAQDARNSGMRLG